MDIAHVQAIEAHEAEYRQKQREFGEWSRRSMRELAEQIGKDDMLIYLNPYRNRYSTPLIDA